MLRSLPIVLLAALCLSSGTVLAQQTATVPDSAASDSTMAADPAAADTTAAAEEEAVPADTVAAPADSTPESAEQPASPGLISEAARFFREGGFAESYRQRIPAMADQLANDILETVWATW